MVFQVHILLRPLPVRYYLNAPPLQTLVIFFLPLNVILGFVARIGSEKENVGIWALPGEKPMQ